MSMREALLDERETLRNLVQSQAAQIEELERLIEQAAIRVEELEAQIDSFTEQQEER